MMMGCFIRNSEFFVRYSKFNRGRMMNTEQGMTNDDGLSIDILSTLFDLPRIPVGASRQKNERNILWAMFKKWDNSSFRFRLNF
jgi:hypothetical protein